MASVVAVFAADLHISENIWRTHPGIAGDSFFALHQLVRLAKQSHAPLVLAGDCLELMHTASPSSKTVSVIERSVRELREAGCALYYICGQHDLANPSWIEAINPWAQDVSMRVFLLGDRRWYGIGYQSAGRLPLCVSEVPADVEGLVMHQRWQDLGENYGGSGQGKVRDVVDACPNVRRIVTGDMHQTIEKPFGQVLVLSPGATHKRSVSEPNIHRAMLMRDDGSWMTYPLQSRPVIEVTVTSQKQWNDGSQALVTQAVDFTRRALEVGYWPQVATPLVIIEDRANCRVCVEAKELLDGVAHVLPRAIQAAFAVGSRREEPVLALQSADMWQKQSRAVELANCWAEQSLGANSVPTAIVQSVLTGGNLEHLREQFMEGVTP